MIFFSSVDSMLKLFASLSIESMEETKILFSAPP